MLMLQVQKIFSQSAMFSSLTPGSLYQFVLRTEKETYADSSPVTINITTGEHTCLPAHFYFYFLFLMNAYCFFGVWQLLTQWKCFLSIRPHHLYASAGAPPGDWLLHSSCQSRTEHPFRSWSSLMRSAGQANPRGTNYSQLELLSLSKA